MLTLHKCFVQAWRASLHDARHYICLHLVIVLVLAQLLSAVDRGNFKTCDQSFCKRHRAMEPGHSPYIGDVNTFELLSGGSSANIQLRNTDNQVSLRLELYSLEDNTVRLKINEMAPLKQRFEIPVGDILQAEPTLSKLELVQKDSNQIVLKTPTSKININISPFRIDLLVDDEPVMSFNSRGLLKFEHLRTRKPKVEKEVVEGEEQKDGEGDENKVEDNNEEKEEEGLWDETFKTHHDSKPNGPSSMGLDVSFPGYEFVYGLPEHADTLALKSTKSTDPFRMYNLDVFEYEIGNPMALYGAVPYMMAHNVKRTVGVFWLNAAEMWVDVNSNIADKNLFSKLFDLVKGGDEVPQVDTHWMAESGIIDLFLMLGPKPSDLFRQYARLTGSTPLPPLFAIGYHQSRWNYNDEQDVANVNAGFDEHDIPLDVIWLDIEHTDGKRYFTWDAHKFPHSIEMVNNVSAYGRKMVTIVDPHIKRDDAYHVYKEAKDLGYYVKTKDGADFEGWCWPGTSSWPDFFNPLIRQYWASKFSLEEYKGSTLDLFTWNDMNEPSVFSGPEITMHKDSLHHGGWEHRDLHNLYGLYVHRATTEGQLMRDADQRPFVLSRAFFAGSQKYGAVWTGDNTGDWSHLKISLPMVLSLNLAGITFSGADVGGFFKNPDAELLTRWYQAAAYQPFFRAHAHLDTRRREPWLQPQEHMKAIRTAIRHRYRLLPYWYTLFFNAELHGGPVMKPLWVDFPDEKVTFNIENEHLVGSAILVHPVTDAGASGVNVYLPGGTSQIWYEADTYQQYEGGRSVYVAVDLQKIPVFYRGGFVIPVKERIRRAAAVAPDDPYTLIVLLDSQGRADGDLYHDDFRSFQYRKGHYAHRKFTFSNSALTSKNLNVEQSYSTEAWIERVVIVGLPHRPQQIELSSPDIASPKKLDSTYDGNKKTLVIRKPGIRITADFTIALQ